MQLTLSVCPRTISRYKLHFRADLATLKVFAVVLSVSRCWTYNSKHSLGKDVLKWALLRRK